MPAVMIKVNKADKNVQKYSSLPYPNGCFLVEGLLERFTPKRSNPVAKRSATPSSVWDIITTLPDIIATVTPIRTSKISTINEVRTTLSDVTFGCFFTATYFNYSNIQNPNHKMCNTNIMENKTAEVIDTNISPKKKGSASKFLIILLSILLLASLGINYYLYTLSDEDEVITEVESQEHTAVEEAEEVSLDNGEWVETDFMSSYTFEYPFGWHVANLWPDDYSDPITIAVHPKPVNTAPRGGPLAEITILDKSGMTDPNSYLQERIDATEDYFEGYEKIIIPTDFGEIYHYAGKINVYGEMEDTERYIFKIQGVSDDNINIHIVEITANPFSNAYSEILKKLVLSFKRVN